MDNDQEQEDRQPSLEDLRGLLYEWEALVKTPGYKRLVQYAKDQVERRVTEIILTPGHGEGVDFARGEAAGIKLFARIADVERERLREEVLSLAKQQETQEEQTNVSTDELPTAP